MPPPYWSCAALEKRFPENRLGSRWGGARFSNIVPEQQRASNPIPEAVSRILEQCKDPMFDFGSAVRDLTKEELELLAAELNRP